MAENWEPEGVVERLNSPQGLATNELASGNAGLDNISIGGGIQLALQRLLVDPDFLFRIEEPSPNVAPGSAYAVSDLDLASRLSFFLWSSLPDEDLLATAESGKA